MIKRDIADSIAKTVRDYPVTVVSGPRQVGKSTLVFHQFMKEGCGYVGLDDRGEQALAKNDPAGFLAAHPGKLIINEAQKAKELFPEIEKIVNRIRLEKGNREANGMFILIGSNSKALLEGARESFSGRVGIIEMSPLSMREIQGKEEIPFRPSKEDSFRRSQDFSLDEKKLLRYIVRGFMPGLYDNPEMDASTYYSSYLQTYMEKDLRDVIDVKDEVKYENFLMLLASNTEEELVYDSYAKQIGISAVTIKTWIDALFKMGIVYLCQPYNETSLVKRVVKRPKLYFFDTGFACYLAGIRDGETLGRSFLKGRFVETYFFNEVRKSYLNSNEDIPFYYYRDSMQGEVDLVLVANGTLSCVEFKSGSEFSKKNIAAFNNLNSTKLLRGVGAIVCTTDKPYAIDGNNLVLPASSI